MWGHNSKKKQKKKKKRRKKETTQEIKWIINSRFSGANKFYAKFSSNFSLHVSLNTSQFFFLAPIGILKYLFSYFNPFDMQITISKANSSRGKKYERNSRFFFFFFFCIESWNHQSELYICHRTIENQFARKGGKQNSGILCLDFSKLQISIYFYLQYDKFL